MNKLNSQVPYFVNFFQLHTFEIAILIDRWASYGFKLITAERPYMFE